MSAALWQLQRERSTIDGCSLSHSLTLCLTIPNFCQDYFDLPFSAN